VSVQIEVITAPGCQKCARAQAELCAAAASVLGEDNLIWREVNVLEELDYAVALGVLTLPAIAVNGELRFSALPTPEQFRAVLARLERC
jgi:thioredoxin 1